MRKIFLYIVALSLVACSSKRDVKYRAHELNYSTYSHSFTKTDFISIINADSAYKPNDTLVNSNSEFYIIESRVK